MTAQETYEMTEIEVETLISHLRYHLEIHRDSAKQYPDDWGYVENLKHIKNLLTEACEFLQRVTK